MCVKVAGEPLDIERVRRVTHRVNCLLRRPEFKADDSEANDLPKPERAREQEPVCKAGSIRRRVGYGPATPARYGESGLPEAQCPAVERHTRR